MNLAVALGGAAILAAPLVSAAEKLTLELPLGLQDDALYLAAEIH